MRARKAANTKENSNKVQIKSDQVELRSDRRNAQKTHSYAKGDFRHWQKRVRKLDSPFYSVQIAYKTKRHRFPLETSNKDIAAKKALDIYQMLRSSGWEATLTKFKPKTVPTTKGSTVGDLLTAATELANIRPTTLRSNVATFRRIVAEVEGINLEKGRFARTGEGREKWLKAVDAVALSKLTPDRIEAWKLAYIRKAGNDQLKERAAKNSVNTLIRMGKSLFAKRLMRLLSNRLTLPSPLPFDGVDQFPRQSMRYTSNIVLPALIQLVFNDLALNDPEAFKAFVLSLFGGLRRNEVDKLRWSSVDYTKGVIKVERRPDFAPKAETSLGDVSMDTEAMTILKELHSKDQNAEYVLASDSPKRKFRQPRLASQESAGKLNYAKYRANDTFNRLTEWLRNHGVNTRTPIHTLRKEAGSRVAADHGLFEASRFLRHADVAITAQHYVSTKNRVTSGIGSLLQPDLSNVRPFESESIIEE